MAETMTTRTVLDRLVAGKREALAAARAREPLAQLRERAAAATPPRDFAAALGGDMVRLIAEVKKASPTKGLWEADFDPVARARTYAEGGAAAVSVLTEEREFLGSLDDLTRVRAALAALPPLQRLPVLRKDFLFDAYQLYEARAAGADAILLIVAILPQSLLVEQLAQTRALGMEALVEVHDEAEVERALAASPRLVGVNNRDLRSFVTDLGVSERLSPLLRGAAHAPLLVSESGISTRADVERLAACGVDAILVGEALMRSGRLDASLHELGSTPKPRIPVP